MLLYMIIICEDVVFFIIIIIIIIIIIYYYILLSLLIEERTTSTTMWRDGDGCERVYEPISKLATIEQRFTPVVVHSSKVRERYFPK